MTSKQKQKLRYAAVRNAYADVETARKARYWSDERIYNELGVVLPKRVPKLRTFKQVTIQRKQRELKRFQEAKNAGINIDLAIRLKSTSRNKVTSVRERLDQWRIWASNDTFPRMLVSEAMKINRSEGLDPHASYGYTTVFYAYVENESIDKWHGELKADKFTGQAVYRVNRRKS